MKKQTKDPRERVQCFLEEIEELLKCFKTQNMIEFYLLETDPVGRACDLAIGALRELRARQSALASIQAFRACLTGMISSTTLPQLIAELTPYLPKPQARRR